MENIAKDAIGLKNILHGQDPAVTTGPTRAGFTATTAAQNHEQQGAENNRCGEDLSTNFAFLKGFLVSLVASCESRAKD